MASVRAFAKYHGMKYITFTFLHNRKEKCVTKEEFDLLYSVNEDVNRPNPPSIGDDLESFLGRIKSGQICSDISPYDKEYQWSFNSCLLTPEEMVKLQQKDETFLKTFSIPDPDIPKAKMDESESTKKFSKSFCWRKTYFMNHV